MIKSFVFWESYWEVDRVRTMSDSLLHSTKFSTRVWLGNEQIDTRPPKMKPRHRERQDTECFFHFVALMKAELLKLAHLSVLITMLSLGLVTAIFHFEEMVMASTLNLEEKRTLTPDSRISGYNMTQTLSIIQVAFRLFGSREAGRLRHTYDKPVNCGC